jgi:hypothetical protein
MTFEQKIRSHQIARRGSLIIAPLLIGLIAVLVAAINQPGAYWVFGVVGGCTCASLLITCMHHSLEISKLRCDIELREYEASLPKPTRWY